MADSSIAITPGAGSNVDTRTNAGGDHRQVVVLGDPSATDGVAVVQASDPASNAQGVVVRDINTSAIVARLGSTINVSLDPGHTLGSISGIGSSVSVHLASTGGTIHTYLDPGTTLEGIQSSVAVHLASTGGTIHTYLDPGTTLEGIQSSVGVHLVGTSGTIGVRVGQVDGTVAVWFSPSSPAVSATFSAASLEVVPTTGSRKTMDDAHAAQRVLLVGSQTAASLLVSGITNTVGVHLTGTSGTLQVALDPGTTLEGIQSSVAVHIGSTAGTMGVRVGQVDGTVAVYFSPSNPTVNATFSSTSMEVVPTTGSRKAMDDAHAAQRVLVVGSQTAASLLVSGITNSINVYLGATAGTIGVRFNPEIPVLNTAVGDGNSNTQRSFSDDGSNEIFNRVFPLVYNGSTWDRMRGGSGVSSAATRVVHATDVASSVNIVAGTVLANNQHTASIFTVSGSTSGGTTSGVTLVSPSANYSFKVFAFSLQTTSVVSDAWRFTNGAGTETELWRGLVTPASSTSETRGANLAVAPPGFLFQTGTSTTLALKSSSGSLVHYSVSFIKESAA